MRGTSVFSFLLGYCEIEIPISACESFMNLCMRYGFIYYGYQRDTKSEKMSFRVPLYQVKRVRSACRVWQIRVLSVREYGARTVLYGLKGRWGLLIGGVLALVLFFTAQSVVWRIDVVGNERLSEAEIIQCLGEQGLSVGSRISGINTASVEQRVMINSEDISYVSITILGTVARVEVREVIDTQINEEITSPANLVSLFDAEIVGMEVYSGFLSVKEGSFVRKGELLVSGIYKEGKAPLRITRASGRILGKVSHTIEVEIPLVQTQKVLTGEKIEKKSLIFFGKSINFFTNYRNLPTTYDIINYVYTLNPFSFGELPISLSVDTYLPYEMKEVTLTDSEAMEQAYELLRIRIDEELPDAQILSKSITGEFKDGKYVLYCRLTAICNIARQVEFEVAN